MLSVRCPALVRAGSVAVTLLGSHAFGQTDRSVGGRLTFTSRPVAGVAVLLAPADAVAANIWPDASGTLAPRTVQTSTDGQGRFQFSGLEARRWSLYVRARGFVPFVARVALDGRVDATLVAAAIVQGYVSDPRRGSVAGVMVRLSSRDAAHTLEFPDPRTMTDAQGRFELGQVPAGQYWLEAYTSDGRMSQIKLDVSSAEPIARDLQLSPPDDPGTVRLRVTDDAGRPLAGAWVGGDGPEHLTDAAGRWISRRYSPGANVRLDVTPGSRPIQGPVIRPPFGKEVLFTLPGGTIEVKAAGRAEDLQLILRGPGWRDPERPYGRPDGAVMRFEGARGGHWSIWAHDKTHRMGQTEFDLPIGGRVSIGAPLDAKGVSVRGRFADDHGRPLARVEVWSTCWTLPFGARADGTRSFDDYRLGAREVRTDVEGRFELADLHPGRHVLTFNSRGGVVRFFFVVVPDGGGPVVDVGDVVQSDEAWALPLEKFLITTQEGIVVIRPEAERRRFRRANGLKVGDLLVAIDGQALGEADDSLALALLEGVQRHDLLVRGPHHEVRVACPPGKPGTHLPFRRGLNLPGQGTDYSMIVEPLAPDHPWHDCLESDDWIVAVSTDPKVQLGVNGRSGEVVDAALASGLPVSVFVRRRGPSRHVAFPER